MASKSVERTVTELENLQHLSDITGAKAVATWLIGQIGRQITLASFDTVNDTMTFSDLTGTLAVLQITYADTTKTNVIQAKRTA